MSINVNLKIQTYIVVNVFGRRGTLAENVIIVPVIDEQQTSGFDTLGKITDCPPAVTI